MGSGGRKPLGEARALKKKKWKKEAEEARALEGRRSWERPGRWKEEEAGRKELGEELE